MDSYFTEQDEVLENKLGIKDKEKLKEAEEYICFSRLLELEIKPVKGSLDFNHLKEIHKRIFSDIYFFAGEVRTVDIAKNGSVFCKASYIDTQQKILFNNLDKENKLRNLPCDLFVKRLAYYSGELNALHPFREGNGRAIRAFLKQLAENAGYKLLLHKADSDKLLEADIAAFHGKYDLLENLYYEITERKD